MREPLKQGETVRWRDEAIPHYWRILVKCVVDRTLNLPFTFERNSHFCARCVACDEIFDPKCANIYEINFAEWRALSHHMKSMKGRVQKVMPSCESDSTAIRLTDQTIVVFRLS